MGNLIVCADGTWNSPDDEENGQPTPTNVVKFHGAIADSSKELTQKKYYHSGVGTEGGFLKKAVGGGTGKGLDENIQSGYMWLATNYAEGDRIYLFGFSRGAYTVRSLAGMIGVCGLLDLSDPDLSPKERWKRVGQVFATYRDRKKTLPKSADYAYYGEAVDGEDKPVVPIHFIGVWDTVGALGIPDDLGLLNLLFDDPKDHRFHDTALSDKVLHARHALAMDERRGSFAPTLWSNEKDHKDMRQIWFPGVHSDIGGGYSETELSDLALGWMIEEAEAEGLVFRSGVKGQLRGTHHGLMHDSVRGVFKYHRTVPRAVPRISEEADKALFHVSAVDRHREPPLAQPEFWKGKMLAKGQSETWSIYAREPWNATGLFMIAKETYELSATGEWLDASIPCGPAGMKDGKFHIGEVAHVAASFMDELERGFKKLSGNEEADFWLSRRHHGKDTNKTGFEWFALVGAVANGSWDDVKKKTVPHEVWAVGKGCRITPERDGYFYAYANDAWKMYGNNRGSVRLTVKRI